MPRNVKSAHARDLKAEGTSTPTWKNDLLGRGTQFKMKRDAVVREAGRAFRRRGYTNTSLEDIAKELKVTKAALYHYVKSKPEILFECHKMALDAGKEALDRACRDGRSPLERISLYFLHYIELLAGGIDTGAVLMDVSALLPEHRRIVASRRGEIDQRLRSIIAEGIADGSIAAEDPKLTIFYLMGTINWIAAWYREDGSHRPAEIARIYRDMLVNGLAPRRAAAAARREHARARAVRS